MAGWKDIGLGERQEVIKLKNGISGWLTNLRVKSGESVAEEGGG